MLKAPMRLKCGVTKDVNTVYFTVQNINVCGGANDEGVWGSKSLSEIQIIWNMKIFRCPQDIFRPSAFLFLSL